MFGSPISPLLGAGACDCMGGAFDVGGGLGGGALVGGSSGGNS